MTAETLIQSEWFQPEGNHKDFTLLGNLKTISWSSCSPRFRNDPISSSRVSMVVGLRSSIEIYTSRLKVFFW